MTKELTDREIDERVAKALGWKRRTADCGEQGCGSWVDPEDGYDSDIPSYSTDIRAAFELMENGFVVDLTKVPNGWIASPSSHGTEIECVVAKTAPLAICLAFLKLKEKAS